MTTEPKPRRAIVGFRVTSAAPIPVRVQFLDKAGAQCYPEFQIKPGGSHITVHPEGFDSVMCWSSRPRMARFIKVEQGFWMDGAWYTFPASMCKARETAS